MAVPLPPMELMATGVGALPHTDPKAACDAVISIFPHVPYVPTLPNRSVLETIVFNDSEHLPGRVIVDNRLFVDTRSDCSSEMEQIYLDYLQDNAAPYAAGNEYASGFHTLLDYDLSGARVVKCQVTGPVTFGMQVVDEQKRPIHYDPEYADILGKMIALRARWFEDMITERTGASHSLVVLNEPYLAALGSTVVPLDAGMVQSNVEDVKELLKGSLGIHCCSNTDWGFLMSLDPALLSIDAYQYSREFLLYMDDLAAYMESGGVVAWGLIPSEYEIFAKESLDSLLERFMQIKKQVCMVVDSDVFYQQSMIMPTCGIRFADEMGALKIMRMTDELSRRVRGDVQ